VYDSKLSSIAEYGRGALGAIDDFLKFALGRGGNLTYKEGDFEADEMASSIGVKKALEDFRNTSPTIGSSKDFSLKFSPNPKDVINKTLETGNPLNGFSQENKAAHADAFNDQSWTKLYVGGYSGTMTLINANTVKIIIENKTTANSLLLHGGELIFGKENGAKKFNDSWNKTPFLNTLNQRFEFTVPLKK
jgi:hypothetical protein